MLLKRTPVVVSLLAVCCLAALWAGFFLPSHAQRESWFGNSGFYFIFAAFALWVISLLRVSPSVRTLLHASRLHWPALLLALGLCISAFLLCPPKIRILYDEPNLIGVSTNFYYDHNASIPKNSFFLHGIKTSFLNQLDKRPLAFPFLLYAAHVLTGYSGYNGFIINFLAAFGVLFVWYVLLRRWFPQWIAYAGMILLAAYPLFAIYATSSGFEIVNLFFILLSFHFFNQFLDQRTSVQAERLLMTLVILAQTRYESPLFLLVFVPFVVRLLPKAEYGKLSALSLAAPLLLLPVAWQDVLFTQPQYHEIDDGSAIFGLSYLVRNLKDAATAMLGIVPKLGMLAPVAFLACAGCILAAKHLLRKQLWQRPGFRYPVAVCAISYLLVTIMQFSYHLAILSVTTTTRLGIIYLPVLVLLALLALHQLGAFLAKHFPTAQYKQYILLFCCGILLYAWPVAGIDEGVSWLIYYRRYDAVMHYLEKNYPRRKVLVIDERSHPYTIHRYSSMNFFFTRNNLPLLLNQLQQHMYKDILLLQNISLATGNPAKGYELPPRLPLQTLYEEQVGANYFLRISRILRPDELPKKSDAQE